MYNKKGKLTWLVTYYTHWRRRDSRKDKSDDKTRKTT